MTRIAALVGLLIVLLFAGCANVPPTTQGEQPKGGALRGSVVADKTAMPSTTGSLAKSAAKAAPHDARPVAKASPPFDLTSLEKRLKETEAIGVLAKVALRNQIDDLLSQFRAFHQGKLQTTLGELRRPYDLLILRVLSLLRDSDPSLAAAIVASREALWGILSDPAKFVTL